MSDASLKKDILEELDYDPRVNARDVGVSVHHGVVALTGHVASLVEKTMVERAVARVKGVRGIAQEIEVRLPTGRKTNDDEIAERALRIISWDTTIPSDSLQVKVEKGWVTLRGLVQWDYQRQAAADAVRKLSGVIGLTNDMTIAPSARAIDIKMRIENALRREAELEAHHINVGVVDGKVTLEGKVHALHERAAAQRAAWSAPGVHVVHDLIKVE